MIMKKFLAFIFSFLIPVLLYAMEPNISANRENSFSVSSQVDSKDLEEALIANSQKEQADKEQEVVDVVTMKLRIGQFYRDYCKAINADSVYFNSTADSLVAKFCVKEFYDKVKDEFETGVGYDFVTADYGISKEALDSISVIELNPSLYKVQYSTKDIDASMKPITLIARLIVKIRGAFIEDVIREDDGEN